MGSIEMASALFGVVHTALCSCIIPVHFGVKLGVRTNFFKFCNVWTFDYFVNIHEFCDLGSSQNGFSQNVT